jgi:hypothetical protein
MHVLSTIIVSNLIFGYNAATSRHDSRKRPSPSFLYFIEKRKILEKRKNINKQT